MLTLVAEISAFLPAFLVSPTVYAGMLLTLSSASHARGRGFAVCSGALATIIVIGYGAVSAGNAVTNPKEPSTLSGVIDIVLGVVLLIFGAWRFFHPHAAKEKKPGGQPRAFDSRLRFCRFFVLGILLSVTNPTSLASYLSAAKLTVDSGLGSWQQFATMALAGFYYLLPFAFPLALALVAPETSTRFLGEVNILLKKYGRYVMVVFVVAIGAYLMNKGVKILK